MSTKPKPPCVTVFKWLKDNLGNSCLGGLTGSDTRALEAAVQIIQAYAFDESAESLRAFGKMAGQMQRSTQELAYHSIAHVLNWEDRDTLWLAAGLQPFTAVRVCAWEPGGVMRGGRQ